MKKNEPNDSIPQKKAPQAWLQKAVTFLLLLCGLQASAQDVRVSGKVTDSAGAPLSGASVTVRGGRGGTATDASGNFTISAPSSGTLVISALGYATTQEAINGRTEINISLFSGAAQALDQVVVVGYGTQRRIDVTGSVASVSGADIAKQASINPVAALQGKAAGVQITNSGAPGASPQVRIRGIGSISGNASPLYVVDGVWFDDISFLNPQDIENISVLKDASSTAIYGIRAANGVILITTKRGKGKATVNYSGYVGLQRVTNQVQMANGSEYAQLVNEKNRANTLPNPGSFGEGTNWFDVVLRNAMIQQHTVTVAGSGEKSNYSLSLGYLDQQGIVETNKYKRVTVRLQNDIQVTNFFKMGINSVLQGSNSNDIPDVVYKAYTAAPIVPVRYADGNYGDPNDFPIGNVTNNPQAQLDFFNQKSKNYRITGNVYGDVTLAKGLVFHSSFGGEFGQNEVRGYTPVYAANTFQFSNTSRLSINRGETRNWILENTLTWDKTVGNHKIRLLAGQSAQRYRAYSLSATADSVPNNSDADYYLRLGSASNRTISDAGSLFTYASYFGRVNYSFKNRYLLNASIRADGSSKFIGSDRWGYFPSVGLGWVVSEEGFMQGQNFFDQLKLRASYGRVGNANVPVITSTVLVTQTGQYVAVFGNQPYTGANISQVVPPATQWERGEGVEVGIEGSIKRKLSFEAAYYNRRTIQAIFSIPILGSVGTSSGTILGNQADIVNQGIEVTAGWKGSSGRDFSYTINGNFSYNHNEVTSTQTGANPLFGGAGAVSGAFTTRTVLGQPIGQFYGLQVVGIFQNAADVAGYIQPTARPGDFKYADANGDKIIDEKDRVVLGNPNPKYFFGLNTTFNYKAFDLTLDIQGVAGVQIYNANKGYRFGYENFTKDFFDNRWHGEGTSNTYPSADIVGEQNYRPNSWYVENGSYVRLRNAQVGYALPGTLTNRWKIQRVRFYVNAQNALNLFGYTGFTPEVGGGATNGGVDLNVYPISAIYNFGVNVTF